MKITIISLNYYPEDTAIGLYSTQMAEYLVQNDWDVTVITGFPYYPEWQIWDAYKNKNNYLEENINGVQIFRFRQFVPADPTFFKRIIHILDFTSGSLSNIKKVKKTDVVLSVIPFTSSAWLGKKLARRLHAKHWIHIQDFEFDVAYQSGVASKRMSRAFLPKILFNVESSLLNSAQITSTISETMLQKLKNKTTTKTFLFPNWIDSNFINPELAKTHAYLQKNTFKILYSGSIGSKQDWNFFLEIVTHFENDESLEFIVVGDGAKKAFVEKLAIKFNHVSYKPNVPYIELNDLLCSADLHILFQKEDVINAVMPSKILGMMASGKPSIITGKTNSEVATIIRKANAGKFFDASDFNGVIEAILFYKYQSEYKKNGRDYSIENYSKNNVLASLLTKLNQLVHG
jgi:colanic acid biosynthesis glycosyl transferase WcaI